MKTKHTPGPWIIDDLHAKDKYSSVLWYDIKDSIGTKLIEVKGIHYGVNNDEAEANANLIVAAPEMLGRLEFIVEYINTLDNPSVALQLVRAEAEESIKKAT